MLNLIYLHLIWRFHGLIHLIALCSTKNFLEKPNQREQSYLLQHLIYHFPLDRTTIRGTLNRRHKFWSEILVLTSHIAALLAGL